MKNTEGYAALNRGTLRMLLGFVLAFALVFGLLSAAIFAETATAADMRLQSTTGTVSLKNASGKSVSIREGMKLYSGYTLSTSSKSYAYVSLDSSKVVKLDASTTVQVKKSGSKLELLVSSGKLFFNVSAPLSSSETLNIRTSTMVTGVRGTSGVVSTNGSDSSVDIYDGTVTVNTVSGGESFTVSAGESLSVSSAGVTSSELTAADIPGFAAVEIAGSESLQERIESASGLDVGAVVSGAEEKLASDEAEAEAAQAALEEAAGELNGGSTQLPGIEQTLPSIPVIIPDFTDAPSPTDTPTADPSTDPSTDPSDDPTDEPTAEPSTDPVPSTTDSGAQESDPLGTISVDTTMTAAQFDTFLSSGSTITIKQDATLTISSNLTLDIADFTIDGGGTLATSDGATITFNGTANIHGDITFEGKVEISGGTLVIDSGATLTNNGYIELKKDDAQTAGTITNNGTIVNTEQCTIMVRKDCRITNNGTITNNGWITTEDDPYTVAITGNGKIDGTNVPVASSPVSG